MGRGTRRERMLVLGGGALSVAVCAAFHLRLLPGPGGALGHDWSYFLPQFLAGAYWMASNGATDVPWFTPAWLGGVPFHPNPQNLYWSLPQQLCRFTDPLSAARITLVACLAVSHAGTYILLRRAFGLRRSAAAFGAVAFGWNGYLASRMLIGHVVYHTFALVPLVALLVLGRAGGPERTGERGRALSWTGGVGGVGGGALLALMVHACDLHGLPVAALTVAALVGVRRAMGGSSSGVATRAAVAVGTAAALSASKLVAMATFLSQFPRDGYPLPGARGVLVATRLAAEALFWRAPTVTAADVLTNAPWAIDRHELEYGVTPVVALVLAVGLVATIARRSRTRLLPTLVPTLAVTAILAVPIALNVHDPAWERMLKAVPILGSGTNMLRMFSLYVPLTTVVAAIVLDRLALSPRVARPVAAALIVAVITWHVSDDRAYYAEQPYRGDRVVRAWEELQHTGAPPPVRELVRTRDAGGRPAFPIARNEAFVDGASQLTAFEPIFGYRLEWLPPGDVRPGDVRPGDVLPGEALPEGARPNVRDPARFLWPDRNGGPPGSAFPPDRREDAARFLAYRPFPFERGTAQRVADALNALSLAALALLAAAGALRRGRRALGRARQV